MIIKKLQDVPLSEMHGHEGIKKQIPIGPDDGSNEIVLRYFSIAPGAASPHHSHDFPHLIKIEAGNGVAVDENGKEHPVEKGNYLYVNGNDIHQLKNAGEKPFDFICIVPGRGEG